MLDTEKAKNTIRQLTADYEELKRSGSLKKYKEAQTRKNFILPLFEALGWNVYSDEVVEEDTIVGKRVDYGFYLNGAAKFYLEAKPLSADIHKEEYAEQAIKYAWNKGVTWAVLSDFESTIVFNALSPEKSLHGKKYFEIPYTEYLSRFDQLQLLSKESFIQNLLDREAEKHGKKLTKISVTETLAKDLNECRRKLTEAFLNWNRSISITLIDEGVQKLLDRLIFVRVAEDRGVEPPTLQPIVHEWLASGREKKLYQAMIGKFREFDAIYNSNLFAEHPFEKWEEYSDATKEVIEILQGKKNYVEYDFSVIPSDVLGSVYESYLGYKLQKSKQQKIIGEDLELGKDARKRKEQGIYYTPKLVVDYIVKNALGPALARCKSMQDLQNIKVLDPACGSGSFLVAAFDLLLKEYEKSGKDPKNPYVRASILERNIYGVDLDQQAVELARLNLLLNVFDSQIKLPDLGKNIKTGNSLISGTDKELEKQFGRNWRDKKPFNWKEEFPDVFRRGGFDCVIGNPPWGANIDEYAEYFASVYPNSTKNHKDIYKIFIDKGISLLREGGNLGFILPNTFLYQPRYEDIKEIVNKNENFVVNLGEHIFQNVELPSCILILEKKFGTNKFVADLSKESRDTLGEAINAVHSSSVQKITAEAKGIVKNTGTTFDDVFLLKDAGIQYASMGVGKAGKGKSDLPERIFSGIHTPIFDVPFYTGSNISKDKWFIDKKVTKYFRSSYKDIVKSGEWVHFTKNVFDAPQKIVWRQTSDCIKAALMDFQAYFGKTIHAALIKDEYKNKIDIHYALAIFNSKYLDYLYRQKVMETGKVFPQVKLRYLRDMPFVIAPKEKQKDISGLAEKMVALNTELREAPEHSEKWGRIKSDIEKTDRAIDAEVYRLYGLTAEEIEIIGR